MSQLAQAFDLRTVVSMSTLMAMFVGVILYFQKRSYGNLIPGLDEWSRFPMLGLASAALLSLRNLIPDLISIPVANALLMQASLLMILGTKAFYGQPFRYPRWAAFVGFLAASLTWYTVTGGDYGLMVAFVASVLGVLSVWHFCVLFKQQRQSFASRFAAWFLVVYAAIVLTRAVTAVLGTPPTNLFDPSPIQTLYITGSTLALFCLSISAVLMASERTRDELTALLRVDALSGVYTRRALLELAEMELARSDRSGRPFSVLMIDIDHFKRVNDSRGHQAGDRVIRDVAQRTAALLRRPSLVGRYGGEEFLAVLSETTAAEARAVAERVREAARDAGNVAGVTVSIGVATFVAGMPLSLPHLIGLADTALYRAKAKGRNRVEHEADHASIA